MSEVLKKERRERGPSASEDESERATAEGGGGERVDLGEQVLIEEDLPDMDDLSTDERSVRSESAVDVNLDVDVSRSVD